MLSYRRDRAAGWVALWVSNGPNRRLDLGDNTLRTFQVYLQPVWHNWSAKQSNSV